VLTSHTYRLLKGSSWGIVITVRGEVLAGAVLSPQSLKIGEALWLQLDLGWRLGEEEMEFLKRGLLLVRDDVEKVCRGGRPILVRLIELQHNPTDYQPEGLAAAIAEWTAQACGFPKPQIPAGFDRTQHRYVFDFSRVESDRLAAANGACQATPLPRPAV
jgi:hypothetical protein